MGAGREGCYSSSNRRSVGTDTKFKGHATPKLIRSRLFDTSCQIIWERCGSTVIDEKCRQTYLVSSTLKHVRRHGKRHNKSVDTKSPTCQHPTLEFNKAYPLLTRLSLITTVRPPQGSPDRQDTPKI